jgi:thiamine-monophosphate kinase
MRGEDRLTAWLSRQAGTGRLLGDDAAFLSLPGDVAVTVDSQIEGVHFLPGLAPERIARRLLAGQSLGPRRLRRASGVSPSWRSTRRETSPTGASFPPSSAPRAPRAFDSPAAISPAHRRSPRRSRSSARGRAADAGCVAIKCVREIESGWAARWAKPRPVCCCNAPAGRSPRSRRLWRALRGVPSPVTCCRRRSSSSEPGSAGSGERLALDISDGLARDLHRLCRASGVGAEINGDGLPMGREFSALCAALRANPMQLALAGGEDYVLLFALPGDVVPPQRFNATAIGIAMPGRRVTLHAAGKSAALPDRGFDHLQQ